MKLLKLTILIPWFRLEVGMSVFVPCLDTPRTEKAVREEAALHGFEVVCIERIEKGKLGLRVWRVA